MVTAPPQAEGPIRTGEVLLGKYRVERTLGAGGMGVVVEATHLTLGNRVAMKFMRHGADADSDAAARFLLEAQAASRLQSPHVAHVLDVGTLPTGEQYMIMELLRGSDLSDLLRSEGPQPPSRAVSFVLQACHAIAEAHALGIVHRDLKPSNLFLARGPDGSTCIKVLDFGISKVSQPVDPQGRARSLTGTNAILGSLAYMSPEQIRSTKSVDGRTDIWALGMILYELLTSQLPFEAETMAGLVAAITSEPPIPVHERVPSIPRDLGAVVMRCLSKTPDERPRTVQALARALAPFGPPDAADLVARIEHTALVTSGTMQATPVREDLPSKVMAASGVADTKGRTKAWLAVPAALAMAAVGFGIVWGMQHDEPVSVGPDTQPSATVPPSAMPSQEDRPGPPVPAASSADPPNASPPVAENRERPAPSAKVTSSRNAPGPSATGAQKHDGAPKDTEKGDDVDLSIRK
jgi:serine/threonine-protein kinase